MKKLLMLVLMLCLTTASYATVATIDITVNGQPYDGQDVLPSDIIKVVWNTTNSVMGGYAGLNFDVSSGEYEADSFSTLGIPPLTGTSIALNETANGIQVAGGTAGFPTPAGWLFDFEFHVPNDARESDIIVLDTLSGGFGGILAITGPEPNGDYPYETLHVGIPEPMTIALLGLGGLFLRRRK